MLRIDKNRKILKGFSKQKDICEGPLAKNIILYTLPLMASGILQLMFNAADTIVVGRYAQNGAQALAAVGSTAPLINLIIEVLLGLSVGASVNVAHCLGARDKKGVSESVHTSVLTAFVGGIIVAVVGFVFSRNFLSMMSTPDDIIDMASLYIRIYFLGLPAQMVYNFVASILRSTGDTKHPLYFLVIGGVVNVALNLILVVGFSLDVEGVAIATVVSELISAIFAVAHMMRLDGPEKLNLKKLKIHPARFKKLLAIGIPAGIQGSLYSISTVLIQSSINSFGSLFVTGSTAGGNIEGFVYMAMNAFYHTTLTFVGQHAGAKKFERIKKVVLYCCMFELITGAVLGLGAFTFKRQLLGIYIPANETAVDYGVMRMTVICTTYYLCGLQEVLTGALRGLGSSMAPLLISVVGVCGMRVLWIYTVFQAWRTPTVLFASYPVTWVITAIAECAAFIAVKKKRERSLAAVGEIAVKNA